MVDVRGLVHAPEFPSGLAWMNVERPLKLADLQGKIVLLDFWTYCCINCMHILPELHKLEEQFPETLVVIGVHAPKYTEEMQTENVRQAVMRYDIRHPVVSDPSHGIWSNYAISAWPTVALIDPDGRLVGVNPGEFEAPDFARIISQLETEFGNEGKLVRSRLPLSLEKDKEPQRTLSYPGKLMVHAEADRLFISDSGHHRILITDLHGQVQSVVGTGEPGMEDGGFDKASFRNPQGMTLVGQSLYVADTDNHAVRRIDLVEGQVRRVAGTGEQLRASRRRGPALSQALSSPWDLAAEHDLIYIAMAGNHQIWALDPMKEEVYRVAGTGREALHDDTLERCALAQPSGLSIHQTRLYFADGETSAIRYADVVSNIVHTIAGEGLFDFGDSDGQVPSVRLQHPLGVTYHDGAIYIADTYNCKIKRIDPLTSECVTLLGSGKPGFGDGVGRDAHFWEPGGLSIGGGSIYIADTNNHAIRVADLGTLETYTLDIKE